MKPTYIQQGKESKTSKTQHVPCGHMDCKVSRCPLHCPDCGCTEIQEITSGLTIFADFQFYNGTYNYVRETTDGNGQSDLTCWNCGYIYRGKKLKELHQLL